MKLGERIVISSAIVSLLFAITVLIYCFTSTKTENTKIDMNTRVYELSANRINDSSYDIYVPEADGDMKSYVVTYSLPDISKSNACIMYKSLYMATRVYINGEFIASYGTKEQLPYGKMIGNVRVIVPMKTEYSKGELSIVFTPFYDLGVGTPIVYLGASDNLKLKVIHENAWRIVMLVFMFMVAIICFCLAIHQFVSSAIHASTSTYIYLGWFSIAVSSWIFCSSDLPQFFTNANGAIALLSYMSLAIMGIPFAGYCAEAFRTKKLLFQRIEGAGCLIPFIIVILFMAGIVEPPESVIICHVYIFVIVAASIYASVAEWKHNRDSHLFVMGLAVLIVFVVAGFVFYYFEPELGYDALALGIGLIFFVLDLLMIMLARESRYIKERLSMDIYKEMAFYDKLTGCGNRAALENEIKEGSSYGDHPLITFGMFDLNNLKITNDTHGHNEGDKLIMAAANCLLNSFGKSGKVFRMGGDEFAIILWNEPDRYHQYEAELLNLMEQYNENHEIQVSMAKGILERPWLEGDKFFYKLCHDADELMYVEKNEYHRSIK